MIGWALKILFLRPRPRQRYTTGASRTAHGGFAVFGSERYGVWVDFSGRFGIGKELGSGGGHLGLNFLIRICHSIFGCV
ncbi:hypothetical protein MUK42_18407 [Musa troglodytarum]|uniref:Uncharacterized protein n=1 Tax=Musa troglodytarum TaxID=320322 RepID=A0A9E7FD26_9LILI|nr:hypothetical protein MUK42_18407 [Musa troglodytarum]